MGLVRGIQVMDANGDELTVYEIHHRRLLRTVRQLKLCSGELVEALDGETFLVTATGERLVRIAGG